MAGFGLCLGGMSGQSIESGVAAQQFARDPKQAIDRDYTERIQKYTTGPALNSPLTNYLPASKSVPTPAKVLGDVSGAPGILPYAEDVYRYFRMLEQSSPRVKCLRSAALKKAAK